MSLHFLGIRDNHLVRQQSSPARVPQLPPAETTEEVDSKDVLVQRLLDLANHLQEQDLPVEALSTLHHDVDHMERTWQKRPKSPVPRARPQLQSFSSTLSTITNGNAAQEDQFWRPLSPGLESPIRFAFNSPKHSVSKPLEPPKPAVMPLRAALLANEADALLAKLIKVVSELKTRHQESEHIHDLLVARAEKAALRVTELEERIADLDEDCADTESELNCLRTAMKAIEIQALDHVQLSEDDELTNSIKSWTEQWIELDYKTKKNRKRCRSDGSSSPESVRKITTK